MCSECEGFAERIRIETPREYLDLLKQIKEVLAQGTLILSEGSAELADLEQFKSKGWPDDYLKHTFHCSRCGQRFRLAVETYHGSGGCWEPID